MSVHLDPGGRDGGMSPAQRDMIDRLEAERRSTSHRDAPAPDRLRTQLGQANARAAALEAEIARLRADAQPLTLHRGGKRRRRA